MPTYVCSVCPGSLTPEQKNSVAIAISLAHSEATGAPTYFVQVVIEESKASVRYLGGQQAEGHIWIRGDIRSGRTEGQRQALILQIMREVARITGRKESQVWVYVCNLAPTDMIEYGHVLPAAGQEQDWFDGLPSELKTYLSGLGSNRSNFTL